MNHFTDPELRRWQDACPPEDRDRLVAHLAECGACASRYAAALRARPLAAEEAVDAGDFGAAGYAAAAPGAAEPRQHARWIWSLAAAAVLAAAVAVPMLQRRPVAAPEARFRGGSIHALEPAGVVPRGTAFAWSSALEAPRFRIDVGTGDRVIVSIEADRSPAPPPPELQDRLTPGVDYWWSVTALDRSGQTLQASPRQTFSIATAR